ncbi:MAG: ribosome hibernation-promoting factor, HPF/YfiA family [Spiroplasma sp.]
MIISVHGKNLEITEVINNAIEKSLERLERFQKFIKSDTRAKVEICSYPDKTYKITVSINLPFNKHLQCQVRDHDLYVAIKQMINPLTQQLNHLKTQLENKNFVGAGEAVLENDEEIASDYTIDEFDES